MESYIKWLKYHAYQNIMDKNLWWFINVNLWVKSPKLMTLPEFSACSENLFVKDQQL